VPRTARNDDEIEKTRDEILDQALDMIGSDGYDSLTMRRLGARLGFAAKTIYNYFSCKEEIYIRVLTRGFEELNRRAEEVVAAVADPWERLRALVRTYITFGTENANYYNIMFNWDVPKYHDYVGTILEPIAFEEKKTAFRFAEIAKAALAAIGAVGKGGGDLTDEELTYQILKLWSELHGIVSLFNSRGILEFEVDFTAFVERVTEEMLARFR
jgi:AcrR family transcriptional regulator